MKWLLVLAALAAFTANASAQVGTQRLCYGNPAGAANCVPVDPGAPLPVTGGVTGGGGTQTQVISAATTNATSIKTTAGTLYDITAINTNAATAYLKFYNTAVAPTCNTDTVLGTYPLIQNIPVVMPSWTGKGFSTGIGLCITAGIAANDNTAATTGIAVSLTYK